MDCRIEVFSKIPDARALTKLKKIHALGFKAVNAVDVIDVYTVSSPKLELADLEKCGSLLSNPVMQGFRINGNGMISSLQGIFDFAIETGFLPGVTDNVGNTAAETIYDFFGEKAEGTTVYYSQVFYLRGKTSPDDAEKIAKSFANPLIQRIHIKGWEKFSQDNGMDLIVPKVRLNQSPNSDLVDLNVPDEELIVIGKKGIADSDGSRRGPLALDLDSMKVIRDYFNALQRKPTDIELESLAQTWSEHCKHTIFAAELDEIKGGLFKEKIQKSTEQIRALKGSKDLCASVFVDNSGALFFDEKFLVTDKAETHNSPSALDPFGGAITGIVGVNRDAIGFGMSAKPIINRYGFCFADPKDAKLLFKAKDRQSPILLPERIMLGVIEGVNVGGNCSGIPTPQGFLYFEERYKGKPLVFVGTLGLIPRKVNGKDSTEKAALPGDAIVMVGNRVGQDGIHGATFSSEALTEGSPATAVQIGDPITQKKLSDAIVKEARDLELFNSITDNGAGGLSCSVAEMAKECNGCVVELEKIPVKYPGMQPWKVWVSESQERMTLAIPKEKVQKFLDLMDSRGVESTVIGEFNDSGKCIVNSNGQKIMEIDLKFLHDGLPKKVLKSANFPKDLKEPEFKEPESLSEELLAMLARLNICSKEFVSTQYDFEVQGTSVLKPLQGAGKVNAEATVLRPVLQSKRAVSLSQALFPKYGDISTYEMAACAIDAAIKNLVCVGTKLENIALMDNFCWCSSLQPERLGQLKDSVQACFELSVNFGTPFISGKDSMFNDFAGFDESNSPVKISVPPTLLISSLGIMDNAEKSVSIDFKLEGDFIYALGLTKNELGGSEYYASKGFVGKNVPSVNAEKSIGIYNSLSQAIDKELVASSIPVGFGGLGIALAKACIAGNCGAQIDLQKTPLEGISRNDALLFSESAGRIIVTVAPKDSAAFEQLMQGNAFSKIGVVLGNGLEIKGLNGKAVCKNSIKDLNEAYRKTLRDF
ncbi:MAG: AIR synthase-related protein [Candidatus Diapherotrites archaeon]|nr:AIR synthase-related protein [Candidatus Diapherotrites archaeon]